MKTTFTTHKKPGQANKTRNLPGALTAAALALALCLGLAACAAPPASPAAPSAAAPPPAGTQSTPPAQSAPPAESAPPAQTLNPRITMSVQEYEGDNIAEIPYIEYDGSGSEAIDAINRSLVQGIGQTCQDFMADTAKPEGMWMEIKSYPFTSAEYLQVVVTSAQYPSYGTDGDMFSVNYDITADQWLTNDDALAMAGLAEGELTEAVSALYEPSYPSMFIEDVKLAGFVILDGNVQLLLEITEGNTEADPWKGFYSFVPALDSLSKLDAQTLFDPSIPGYLDKMDPPLAYGR